MSHRNQVIEHIARKSLVCLILTFVVNLAMNLFKVTMFLGDRSDVCILFFSRRNAHAHIFYYLLICTTIYSHLPFTLKLLNPHFW